MNIETENDTSINLSTIDFQKIQQERKNGIREYINKGFDIINNRFFVKESVIKDERYLTTKKISTFFDSFDEFYKYVDGEIYDNACYYQYNFSSEIISKYKINLKKINFISLIDYTINEHELEDMKQHFKDEYEHAELAKNNNKKWLDRFLKCRNYSEFTSVLKKFKKSTYFSYDFEDVIIYQLIEKKPKTAFSIMSTAINKSESILSLKELCLYYPPDYVLSKNSFEINYGSTTTKQRHKKRFENFISNLKNNNYTISVESGFDEKINYYYVKNNYDFFEEHYFLEKTLYFDTLAEFKQYLNNDLSNCNLLRAHIEKKDIENCVMNDKTILPYELSTINYSLKKYYNYYNKYDDEFYVVSQKWYDQNNNVINENNKMFSYFFDFAYYLKNDLSNSELLIDGLLNLNNYVDFNFENAHLTSSVMDKFGISYKNIEINNQLISFDETISNEKETDIVLYEKRENLLTADIEDRWLYRNISYISDIHLLHRLKDCKSETDIDFEIKKIVNEIYSECSGILLIGGDVSSSYYLYEKFIKELSNYNGLTVIFVLGNHELWEFSSMSLNNIVKKYRELITSHGMYLIQNSLIYFENYDIREITEKEINENTVDELRKKLNQSRLVVFGGIGFSGYNNRFNADVGLYRSTINRKQEISETFKFEKLYNKMIDVASDKNTIILTHMSKSNWSSTKEYINNFVYVSGHDHRNYYFDDGSYRIYADNQLGYNYKHAFTKSFYIEYDYDYFSDYKDGIHEITKDDYISFHRGKNIMMDYNREGKIYMLKKGQYYCFLKPNENGGLCILNGGSLKKLENKNINYYYNNMDKQILIYKKPLDKYTEYQTKIANAVRDIGGDGTIHGSIVDIDFYNHIYVNPFDLSLTAYYAENIITKLVYENIPSLLKTRCPLLYENYEKKLSIGTNVLVPKDDNSIALKPQFYFDTDIYKASREIKKMQRLKKGILTIWYENSEIDLEKKEIGLLDYFR